MQMKRIIAITNQKGGVGKTTTAINLAAAMAESGKKVLLIDMDPQGNASSGLGIDKDSLDHTSYEVLMGESSIQEAVIRDVFPNLDVLPSSIDLSGAEIELIDVESKEYRLKNAMESLQKRYDYAIIDCPPALSMLTINALTTADSVLVPIQCEFYALEGLTQLLYTIDLVKKKLNPELYVEGIVFTMYDMRTNLSLQVVENVRENLKQHIYRTVIPRNVRLAEAPSYGQPINVYDPKSSGAGAYARLAQEVIKNTKRR